MKSEYRLVVLALIWLLALPFEAAAYLDPGTGSMVLQMAIGGLLAGLATVKIYWSRIKSLYGRRSEKADASSHR